MSRDGPFTRHTDALDSAPVEQEDGNAWSRGIKAVSCVPTLLMLGFNLIRLHGTLYINHPSVHGLACGNASAGERVREYCIQVSRTESWIRIRQES